MRKITKIIIHCTATPAGRAVTVAEIDSWHRSRGFAGIGYHYVIMLDGRICKGRQEHLVGAHCKGHNASSIGIVYVGGMSADMKTPLDTRTAAQKIALKNLINNLSERFPGLSVHGHNEFAAKACPCFDVRAEFGDNC